MPQPDLHSLIKKAYSNLRTPVPLCKVCDLPEHNDPEWLSAASDLGLPTDGTWISKKYWEYTHILYGLRRLDCIQPDARVLSVGCGTEPNLYYLTNYVAEVVGIDLFEGDSADALKDPDKYATLPYRSERLKLLQMDGCKLRFPSNSFDIVYSLSSIEHFGGHAAAAQAMSEIGRVLKVGGIAVIATELVLTDENHPEFFNWTDLQTYVIHPSMLELVEPVDLSISDALKKHYVHVRDVKSPLYMLIHYGDPSHSVPFTSVMLFMRKTSSLDLHHGESKSHHWLLLLKKKLSGVQMWVKERIRRAPSAPAYYWRQLKGFGAKAMDSKEPAGSTVNHSK